MHPPSEVGDLHYGLTDTSLSRTTLLSSSHAALPLQPSKQTRSASRRRRRRASIPFRPQRSLNGATLLHMKVEEIAEAVAKLPPDQLARFRRWFTAFEAGRTNHTEELDSVATKLGRLAGRAFRELKRRAEEP